jgi:pimeloyl-ACP methyl ester carboxylesterase
VKPHFFGDPVQRLYGVSEEPRVTVDDPPAILVCYPIAGEYMRAHRAFRQLTNLATRQGAHVLRFDYSGVGDSWGEAEDGRLDRWTKDVRAAVEELTALASVRKVRLVGLRFGATLAALASADLPQVDQVVMWDPIVDGEGYVARLEDIHAAEQAGRGLAADTSGTIGVHGFGVGADLRSEISRVSLMNWEPGEGIRTDVVVSSEEPAWLGLRDHLAGKMHGGRFEVSPSLGNWDEADEFGSALIPQQIIQSVVSCLMRADT